jgi:hypothetical protein
MPDNDIDWEKIVNKAATTTDNKFKTLMASLTRLTSKQVEDLLKDPKINKEELARIIQVLNDAQTSNNAKADAIARINGGVEIVVGLAQKLL